MKGFLANSSLFSLRTFAAALVVVLLAILAFFAWGLKPLVKYQLEQQGFHDVAIDDLSFNPFKGRIQLSELRFIDSQQETGRLGSLQASIDYSSLFSKRVILENVSLEDSKIHLAWKQGEAPSVAGIKLAGKSEEQTSEPSSWQFGIQQLKLDHIELKMQLQEQTQLWQLRRLQLKDLYSDGDHLARLSLLSQLNSQPLNVDLNLLPQKEHLKLSGTFRIKHLDLTTLLPILQSVSPDLQTIKLPQGILDLDSTFTVEQKQKTVAFHQQGNLQISQLKLQHGEQRLEVPKLTWQGSLQSDDLAKSRFIVQGSLDSEPFALQQTDLQLKARLQSTLKLQADLGEKLEAQLKGPIKLSDIELKQNTLQTALKSFSWDGQLAYQSTADYPLQLGGSLKLVQLNLQDTDWSSAIQQIAWQGDLKTHFNEQKPTPQLLTQATLDIQKWHLNSADGSVDNDSLHSDFQITINKFGENLDYQGTVQLAKIAMQQTPLKNRIDSIVWQGSVQQNAANLNVSGDIQAQGIKAETAQNIPLAELSSLELKKLLFSKQSESSISVNGINLKHVALQDPQNGNNFILLEQLNLNKADWHSSNRVKLGNILLDGSNLQLDLDKNNHLAALDRWLAASGFKTDAAPTDAGNAKDNAQESKDDALLWQLAGIEVSGKNSIHIQSEQTSPALSQTLELETFTLGKLDSAQAQAFSDFAVKLKLLPFSELSTSGKIAPLAQPVQLQADTNLSDLSLLEYSPLLEKALGYQIESGQLSAKLNTQIIQGKIDSSNRIQLRQFILKSIDKTRTDQFESGFSLPLQTGLSLLEDKNKQIDLNLPVKGDLSNPDFQIGDVISKAINNTLLKATKTYLLLALQPFGAIALVGGMALDQLSAIELQSVDFAPGSSELSPDMQQYLQKIHQLLQQRSKVQIKLCGGANARDRDALEELKKQALKQQNDAKSKEQILEALKVANRELTNLAVQRQTSIKRYLIGLGTTGTQLILCQPEFDKGSKTPRIRLEI
ncbi:DUF748 domain-containing protein [Thiomicrorhabdus sp.]|uniref:DUF748 domain-containing protein n=1 Tax=Thiomicrorhabdus sp. TaxID=2039724 RepID=UPI0029C91330|nr:DUF748 domain-containing protein [Thiomicrorhabdus sp.]